MISGASPKQLSDVAFVLCALAIVVVPLAHAGLALINAGLGRSRSAAHALVASLCVIGIAAGTYFVCGFSLEGFPGRAAHVAIIAGKSWDILAAEPLFMRGLALDGSSASLAAWLQMFAVGLAALIPLGTGADRWRLGAICASTFLLAGFTYPLFAHAVWGGGWLAQLGANYHLGTGFIDNGGAGSIQAVGGLTALAMTWILGPRRGKFEGEGMSAAIPGHNTVIALFGCVLAWIGWIGLNTAATLLFYGAEPVRVVRIGVTTTLAAAGSALAVIMLTRLRFGKCDASLVANGWVAGLVAGSASCAFASPQAAVLIGVAAGAMVVLAVGWLEALAIDDPAGAIATHGFSGMLGLLAAGIVANRPGQIVAQLLGIAALLGFVLPLTYSLNWLLDRVLAQRVDAEGERNGLDLHELGADAYPEFSTVRDDFYPR